MWYKVKIPGVVVTAIGCEENKRWQDTVVVQRKVILNGLG